MTPEIYSVNALRTISNFEGSDVMDMLHAASGLAGESGEVIDIMKKVVFQGKELDRNKMIGEIGDVAWYMNLMIHKLGITWGDVFRSNIAKLDARYPGGKFTLDACLNRCPETEAEAIEQVL